MCGRFTLAATPAVLVDALLGIHPELVPPATAQPRCNIAPTQEHFIFAGRAERIAALPADWGLVNSWAADAKRAARQINARLETAAESRAYAPAFKRRRCAVPADGWYEWSGLADARRPHWIHRGDEAISGNSGRVTGVMAKWRGSPERSIATSASGTPFSQSVTVKFG